METDLTHLKPGEEAIVLRVDGGYGTIRKINSLGIREGKKITKISSRFRGGPQVIRVGSSRIAMGFGMAKKIIVEVVK